MTERPSRRRFLLGALVGVPGAAAINAFGIEPRWLEFNVHEIPIEGLDPAFDGYRIGLMADLHYPKWASRELIHHACRLLTGFRPDLIAMPGDLIGQYRGNPLCPDLSGLFSSLEAPDGFVATLGNHDHHGMDVEDIRRRLAEETPIRLIDKTHFLVSRGDAQLAVGGVGDMWEDPSTADEALAGVPPDVPRILLSHNPDYAEYGKDEARVDLILSGHTHGGQIRVPGYGALRVPSDFGRKFEQGLVQGKRYRVFVTRGVCTMLYARFLCRPEVNGLILRRA